MTARRGRLGLGACLGAVLGLGLGEARAAEAPPPAELLTLRVPDPPPAELPEPAPSLPTPAPVVPAAPRVLPAPAVRTAPPPALATELPVALELAALAAAQVQLRTYGFGGGLEVGVRWQLRLVGLGLSLRALYEGFLQPEPAPRILALGLPLSLRLGRPAWRLGPYLGLGPQLFLQRVPEAFGVGGGLRHEVGAALSAAVGLQLRLGPTGTAGSVHGGPFVEAGYRRTVYNPTGYSYPAWDTASVLIGYRLSTR